MTAGHLLLAGAPPEYAMPAERPSLDEAKAWCRALAASHYENFHVATWFLPRAVRPHFESIYGFCRVADDLGDEIEDPVTAMRLLTVWDSMLDECYDTPEEILHPVFVALRQTIVECGVPRELFHDLVTAFKMDQVHPIYETLQELLDYSHFSANPVGRLVLWVCGYRSEELNLLSDKVCTALQLANFWQDVVEDTERGRRYLPGAEMRRFGVEDGQIEGRVFTPQFRELMQNLVQQTRSMLTTGGKVSLGVDRDLAVTLNLFRRGGDAILDGIEGAGFDVLRGRPVVTKRKKAILLGRALCEKMLVLVGNGQSG